MTTIETDQFNCAEGERAAFEAGIKLGSLFHQFIGVPVRAENRSSLEKAMTSAVLTQPHVIEAEVRIDEGELSRSLSRFGYCSLNERMIDAKVSIRVGSSICNARLGWMEEMGYPLMWIESMRKEKEE